LTVLFRRKKNRKTDAPRRRLRRPGQVFLLIALLLLLAAWNTGTNLYYLVFGGVASFVAFSVMLSGWSLRHVRIEREAPTAVHRDEPFGVTVRVENRKRILPCVSVRIESGTRPGESAGYVLMLPAKRAAILQMTELFKKRGVYRLPALQLVSTFPFGLIETHCQLQDNHRVVVYPRVRQVRTVVLEQAKSVGEAAKIIRGDGDEFFSLREYLPGDDPRFISWRASARMGTLLVRELYQDASRSICFILDNRLPQGTDTVNENVEDTLLFHERLEDAIELVASLALMSLNQQYSVALLTASGYLHEGEGTGQVVNVLDTLARLTPARPDARDPFASVPDYEESVGMRFLLVSPYPYDWGRPTSVGGARVIDPREVVYA
jgi:uncharacterized protein (DUF58 family)